jgi:hypothetical protein
MKENRDLWNFAVWQQWNLKIYHESLTADNIVGKGTEQLYTDVFAIDDAHNVVEWVLPTEQRGFIEMQKGTKKYLLPTAFLERLPLKPTTVMRIQLKKSDKRVFHLITDCKRMKTPSKESKRSFKAYVDEFNPATHEEPDTWTFHKIVNLAGLYKGCKLGLCSEAAGGKNANGTVLNQMFQNVARVQVPSTAQFYNLLSTNRMVVFDEFSSGDTTAIKLIMNSILMVGDDSPEFVKQTMAIGSQANTIDLSTKSVLFTYNRPQDLKDPKKHFDARFPNPAAFQSRFPQLLLPGKVTSNMRKLSPKQAKEIMENFFPEMNEIVKETHYFTDNLHKHMHGWDRLLCGFKARHLSNMEGVIDALDAYCETQEEFNEWLVKMNGWVNDYKVNLKKFRANPEDLGSY